MLPALLESLSFAELEMAINGGLSESRTLDFKRQLVGTKDDDKREFVADVSAFANTIGGDIVFGIEESAGLAQSICGVTIADRDAELLRLETIIRSSIEPRLVGVDFKWLEREQNTVLVCRIQRSFASPHRVVFRGHDKFYARNSSGKYPMDVSELRTAFLSGESLIQNIKDFQRERVRLIESQEGALPVSGNILAVLHLVPAASLLRKYDIQIEEYESGILPPCFSSGGVHSRYTLEGHVSYLSADGSSGSAGSYALLFRNGIIECVISAGGQSKEGVSYLYASAVEWPFLKSVHNCLSRYKRLGIQAPIYVFLSLVNCRGICLKYGDNSYGRQSDPYNRGLILVQEIMVSTMDIAADKIVRPLFDVMWNAFGFSRAHTFDDDDKYIGPKW